MAKMAVRNTGTCAYFILFFFLLFMKGYDDDV